MKDKKYLKLLSRDFPNVSAAANEIINLNAILRLPKGTEYFFSDLHGEHEAFLHMLKSAAGNVRIKVHDRFESSLTVDQCNELANLIYYPETIIRLKKAELKKEDFNEWRKVNIYRLAEMCKEVSKKYTRSKVRKKIPSEFTYVIDELIHSNYEDFDKKKYYMEFIYTVIEVGLADKLMIAMSELIQKLCVDRLHIVGDIFDRGPRADLIIKELMKFDDIDIQWGNHDVSWMGAATGNQALICNVLRIAVSYNCFDVLEDGYSINLRPFFDFAAKAYADDPCEYFMPKILDENVADNVDKNMAAKMHKAISVMQFKLEGQLIARHPEYELDDRCLLKDVDFEKGEIVIEGKKYKLRDNNFPTVDPKDPFKLSKEEEELIKLLSISFEHSDRLHKHIKFIYSHGSMYKSINNNVLYHGCLPMNEDGSYDPVEWKGKKYEGRQLLDICNEIANDAYFLPKSDKKKKDAVDFMWYLWCGPKSPLFGKYKIATFENLFIGDEGLKKEKLNYYYDIAPKNEEVCKKILEEFDADPEDGHIVSGHVPVKQKQGEHPIKANGKMFVIDGGIAKAYQPKTGIAGYTLMFNSRSISLAEHKPFKKDAAYIRNENTPNVNIVEVKDKRLIVADTDIGKRLKNQIDDLERLLKAYSDGTLKESF
ncbi:MAG: fructose-1,6-bisphosphatase [Parasporobacterium sp.]|nr:fructose-1,6-bisphosphatase [Parasporobacterium sp.]